MKNMLQNKKPNWEQEESYKISIFSIFYCFISKSDFVDQKTNHSKKDSAYQEFRNYFPCDEFHIMREGKVKKLFDFIKTHRNLCLLKGPPGSGKTFLSALFRYYLEKTLRIPSSQVFYIPVFEKCDYNNLEELFYQKTKGHLKDISSLEERDFFFIFDEAHYLYSNKTFGQFWSIVKNCSEGKQNIHFLFCAVYSQSETDISEASPLILRTKYQSLEFLQFDEKEFSDLVAAYHKWSPRAEHIRLNENQVKFLFGLFRGHPELSQMALEKCTTLWRDDAKVSPSSKCLSDDDFREKLMKNRFLEQEIIKNCKVAYKMGQNLNEKEIGFLKHIHVYGKICEKEIFSNDLCILKSLERKGICYEDPEHSFYISNSLIGTMLFSIFTEKDQAPINNIQAYSKVEIVVEALKRMDKQNLKNSKKFVDKAGTHLKEDQWVNEIFGCLKSLLPKDPVQEFLVLSQGSTEIDERFVGVIDIYLNGKLNKGFEVLREGRRLLEHILRKYRALFPERFQKIKFETNRAYFFPLNAEYLVIDIRSGPYKKLKKYINIKDEKEVQGEKKLRNTKKERVNLEDLKLEEDLMRVIYEKNMNSLEVHYREELFVQIPLI